MAAVWAFHLGIWAGGWAPSFQTSPHGVPVFRSFVLHCIVALRFHAPDVDVDVTLCLVCLSCLGVAQVESFSATAVQALGTSCIGTMASDSFSLMTPSIAAALSGSQCSALSQGQVAAFNATGFGGLSGSCVGSFSTSSYESACAGITAEQLQVLAPSSASSLTSNCISATSTSAWTLVPAALLGALSQACSGFESSQVSRIPAQAFAGFKEGCMNELAPAACGGFTSQQVRATWLRCMYPVCSLFLLVMQLRYG